MTGVPWDAPRPEHTCTVHEPSRACYNAHRCRCRGCVDANQAYRKRVNHRLTAVVPAAVVAAHIEKLKAAGMNLQDMQRVGGVSEATIRSAVKGRAVQQDTARRILAIRPGGKVMVPSCGAARRLQALSAIGWSLTTLAELCGLDRRRLEDLRTPAHARVQVDADRTIRDLYDRLWDMPQDGQRARQVITRARTRGWLPPLTWDDGTGPHGIDNPSATPYGKTWLQPGGRWHTTAENVTDLAESDENLAGITRRLGISEQGVYKALQRSGQLDVWQKLAARKNAREVA